MRHEPPRPLPLPSPGQVLRVARRIEKIGPLVRWGEQLARRIRRRWPSESVTPEDLPARWEFTDNILEKTAFLAKDVILVVDDLNPESSRVRKEELERRFSRIAASVGNSTR